MVTTLFINYEWRRLISDALQSYADSIIRNLDDSLTDDFRNKFQALLNDLYNEEIVDSVPVGTVTWYIGVTISIPPKWLKCEGQVLNKADYPELDAVLDTPFDTHPTITLPDLRERFLYGAAFNSDLGDTGGESTHTLTIAEMPSHGHVQRGRNGGAGTIVMTQANVAANSTVPVDHATTTANTGGGGSHNNMPPYMRGYWIIKVLP